MPFQQGNIGLEAIHLEPRFLECERNQVLGGAFVARYRGDTDQILRQADARSSVECLEGSCLGPLSDHRVSVVGSGGDVERAVAVRVSDAAEEDTVLAVLWRKRPLALRAASNHR